MEFRKSHFLKGLKANLLNFCPIGRRLYSPGRKISSLCPRRQDTISIFQSCFYTNILEKIMQNRNCQKTHRNFIKNFSSQHLVPPIIYQHERYFPFNITLHKRRVRIKKNQINTYKNVNVITLICYNVLYF